LIGHGGVNLAFSLFAATTTDVFLAQGLRMKICLGFA
jgi:hypothetical protein